MFAPLLLGAVLLALTTGLIRLWQRYALSRVRYERWFEKGHTFPGEPVGLTVQCENLKPLPLWPLKVEEQIPVALQITRRRTFARVGRDQINFNTAIGAYQTVTRQYVVTPNRRGFYRLGPARLGAGDPFGLKEQFRDEERSPGLVVYPKVMPLEAFGLDSRRPLGDLATPQSLLTDPFRVAGTRGYVAGDPLNRIHWGATARTGDLQVRIAEPTQGLTLAICLNCWSFDQFWEGIDPDSYERGCALAASIANWATEASIPISFHANGVAVEWSAPLSLPQGRGTEGLARILEGIARLEGGSPISLPNLLERTIPTLPSGTAVVVITRAVSDELYGLLAEVRRRRPVILFVTGPVAELPPLPGLNVVYVAKGERWHEQVVGA
ncbi:MAG TPA: DUF58 domain-containing protein [Symbiobacteriaceae bacterium]|nr:DUF58 domain-containing protein [Symbiobacteriaceae bacterium]